MKITSNKVMRILFITTSYEQKNNSAAIRNNAWVTGLIENGQDVDVLTIEWPDFMKSDFLIRNNKAKVIKYSLPELNALKITKGSAKSPNIIRKSIEKIRKYLRDFIYFPDVCKNWRKNIKNFDISPYDIIVSSSDFKSSHFVANELLQRVSKKWIQVWGDPWSSDINLSRNQYHRVKKVEHKLLSASNAIIYVSDFTRKELQKQYPDLSFNMHYIPRGYYKSVYREDIVTSDKKDYIDLVYTGILTIGRSIDQLLEAISSYNEFASKKIRLSLYGNYTAQQRIDFSKYNWLKINESIDYNEMLNVYSNADILLFVSNGKNSTQIPGKLFDYMGTSKPIMCICSKDEADLFSLLSNFDRCILPEDYSSMSLIKMLETAIKQINNKFDPVEEFAPHSIGQQLIDIINKC